MLRLHHLVPLAALALAAVGLIHVLPLVWDHEYTVATLDCGKGRRIVLTSWVLHEGYADLGYRVLVDGREVTPTSDTGARGRYECEGGEMVNLDRLHFATAACCVRC